MRCSLMLWEFSAQVCHTVCENIMTNIIVTSNLTIWGCFKAYNLLEQVSWYRQRLVSAKMWYRPKILDVKKRELCVRKLHRLPERDLFLSPGNSFWPDMVYSFLPTFNLISLPYIIPTQIVQAVSDGEHLPLHVCSFSILISTEFYTSSEYPLGAHNHYSNIASV